MEKQKMEHFWTNALIIVSVLAIAVSLFIKFMKR